MYSYVNLCHCANGVESVYDIARIRSTPELCVRNGEMQTEKDIFCESPTNTVCSSHYLSSSTESSSSSSDSSSSLSLLFDLFCSSHCNDVYTAVPVDDPNAFKGAIIISSPQSAVSKQDDVKSNTTDLYGCCCSGCYFTCNIPADMREHFKCHTGKKEYRCLHSDCSFTSSILKDMTFHSGIHTGERPYRCSYPNCGFAAPNQSQLRLHMTSHSNEKPFKCTFKNCFYATRYKSALVNHERTHTGEKPFKCKYCKIFAAKQKSGLQYHIKTVHQCY